MPMCLNGYYKLKINDEAISINCEVIVQSLHQNNSRTLFLNENMVKLITEQRTIGRVWLFF